MTIDGAVLIGDGRKGLATGVRHSQQARGHSGFVAHLGDDGVVADAIEAHGIARGSIRDSDAGKGRCVTGQDLVQLILIPACNQLVLDA